MIRHDELFLRNGWFRDDPSNLMHERTRRDFQYILNKSENVTPELFAIYIHNYANQECNGKCILMFKY